MDSNRKTVVDLVEDPVRNGSLTRSTTLLGLFACIAFTTQAAATESVRIIFDTDITGDVDDVLALAMLHTLADRGECVIEAVTVSKENPLAARFVDATNTFYGRPDIPIGVAANAPHRDSKYLKLIETEDNGFLRYPHDRNPEETHDALRLLRKTLAAAQDNSVALIQVGLAVNLADLLESKADDLSPLDGQNLIAKKVKLLSIMAGAFTPVGGKANYLEANVRNHVNSMQRLVKQWPTDVDVFWSDFNIGMAARYPRQSIASDFSYRDHHIVPEAYLLHSGPDHDRPSWDLTSVLYAVRPDDSYFGLSPRGMVSVDDAGATRFEPNPDGTHRYLTMTKTEAVRVVEAQRHLVSQPGTN